MRPFDSNRRAISSEEERELKGGSFRQFEAAVCALAEGKEIVSERVV